MKRVRVWYPGPRIVTMTAEEFRDCDPIDVLGVKEWTRDGKGPLLHYTKSFIALPPGEKNVKSFNMEDLKSYLVRHARWLKWGRWIEEREWNEVRKSIESDSWRP